MPLNGIPSNSQPYPAIGVLRLVVRGLGFKGMLALRKDWSPRACEAKSQTRPKDLKPGILSHRPCLKYSSPKTLVQLSMPRVSCVLIWANTETILKSRPAKDAGHLAAQRFEADQLVLLSFADYRPLIIRIDIMY